MKISTLLNERLIKVDLESIDKEEVFEEMTDILYREGKIQDRDDVLQAILEREKKGTTGISKGIGIPHAKTDDIEGLTMALGISKEGIDYDALDGNLVHIIFYVLARKDEASENVQTLAEIARLCETPGFIDSIMRAKSPDEVLGIIKQEE